MLLDIFSLAYFVIVDDSESFSPFCGFGENILTAKNEILKILLLPKNIAELGKNKKSKFQKRLFLQSAHCIFPIKYTSFCTSDFEFPCLLPVVIYDENRFSEIPTVIAKRRNQPFLLELKQDVTDKDFIDFFFERIKVFQKLHSDDVSYEIVANLEKEQEEKSSNEIVYKKIQLHGTVSFLIKVLEDNGFKFVNKKSFSPTLNQDLYYKNIEAVNCFVSQFIYSKKQKSRPLIDCIFTSAPLYTRYLLRNTFDKVQENELKRAFKNIISQVGYIHSFDFDESKFMLPVLKLRQEEMQFYYLCLYLIFEKYFCPVIRFPQGVQTDIQSEIDALRNSKEEKKAHAFIDLIKKEELYCKNYVSFINTFQRIPSVKIYSDAPVEFVRDKKNNLPILISTSLCKIPTTPGNTFFNSVANDLDLFIQYEELFEILIIRSFSETDPIRFVLEDSIKDFFSGVNIQHIHYVIEDVHDSENLINVLKKHDKSKIVIFDCHGQQAKKDIAGGLLIGTERFNIWEYVQNSDYFPVPPIVMFSTCNTYPIVNTFNSIANSFLSAGAKTVIATNSPVDAKKSAIFIARILYRIDELLPKLFKLKKEFSWLDFISDFFRMSYITDITRYFCDKGFLNDVELVQLRLDENFIINIKNPEWYQKFLLSLAKLTGKKKRDCEYIINNEIGFTETMKYIVLGNADSIIIHR